jgi:hypothetical protein
MDATIVTLAVKRLKKTFYDVKFMSVVSLQLACHRFCCGNYCVFRVRVPKSYSFPSSPPLLDFPATGSYPLLFLIIDFRKYSRTFSHTIFPTTILEGALWIKNLRPTEKRNYLNLRLS